jgi:hypothetical protein
MSSYFTLASLRRLGLVWIQGYRNQCIGLYVTHEFVPHDVKVCMVFPECKLYTSYVIFIIHHWIYIPLLGPRLFFSFVIILHRR